MLTESEMETPVFAPLAVGLEYCVRVRWASGAEARINHFAAPQDAQRWIDREAKNWLRNRARTLAHRPSHAERIPVARLSARVQIFQTA
jgi:hypothetical protein